MPFTCMFMLLYGSCVVQIAYKGPPVCRVAAGGEFSVIADVVGNLYTFGNPEYGQLGMIAPVFTARAARVVFFLVDSVYLCVFDVPDVCLNVCRHYNI